MKNDSKQAILREWEVWMECFRKSEFQGLRDLGGKHHTAESDASAYLTNSIPMSRKVDLLEINKEQLARNGHEMTELLDKGEVLFFLLFVAHGLLLHIPLKFF
jgi:hypothetical protein